MGTTDLRQLLESLCNNSDWKYAVLWKMRYGSPMILTWEDGYFDCSKPREPLQTISSDVYCNGGNDLVSSLRDASASNANFGGHQIELVMAEMWQLQYPLGEGVVGEVAYTGDHFWLSFNNIFSCEMSKNLVPEFPEEWLLQFASGIKTILLVPVLPHGVLQLGSFDEVAENIQIVAYIKGRFNDLHSTRENAVPLTLKGEFKAQSTLISCPVELLNATSAISISQVKSEDSNYSIPVNSVKLHKDEQPEVFKCESKNNSPLPIFADVSPPSESLSARQPGMVESKIFELSYLMDELQAYSDCNEYNVGWFGEPLDGMMNTYPASDMVEHSFGGMDANDVYHKNRQNFLSFPKGSELHKVLGPPVLSQTNEKTWEREHSKRLAFYPHNTSLHSSQNLIPSLAPDFMSLFIANGNGGGGRILYTNPTRHHPYTHTPCRPHFLFPLRRSPHDRLHIVSASNKKLSSVSRIGKFDSKNRRSSTTSTKDQEENKRDGSGGDENVNGEVKNVSTSVGENYDGYFLPELPGDEPDFWEGPQWDGLGFFVQYMWAFGIVFALVACGIAVATYNGGAADFKETPAYKESIQSRDLLEEPEASNSDVFDSNPTEVAPSLE